MPIVTMVSYAIIYRMGIDEYLQQAIAAGISGAIVPDMPVDESDELAAKCKSLDFSLIQLITPTTPRDRAVQIAKQTTGFIYYVSITGITGERTELPSDLADNLKWLRSVTDLPICVGFGISKLEHVEVLKPVAGWFNCGLGDRSPDCCCGQRSIEQRRGHERRWWICSRDVGRD